MIDGHLAPGAETEASLKLDALANADAEKSDRLGH